MPSDADLFVLADGLFKLANGLLIQVSSVLNVTNNLWWSLNSYPTAVDPVLPQIPSYPSPPSGSGGVDPTVVPPPPDSLSRIGDCCGVYTLGQFSYGDNTYHPLSYWVGDQLSLPILFPHDPRYSVVPWLITAVDCDGALIDINNDVFQITSGSSAGTTYPCVYAYPGQIPIYNVAGCNCSNPVTCPVVPMSCSCEEIALIIQQTLETYLGCVREKICGEFGQRIEDLGNVSGHGVVGIALNDKEYVGFVVATVIPPIPINIQVIYSAPNQYRFGQIALGGTSALAAPTYFNFEQQVFTPFPNPCQSVYWRLEPDLEVNLKAYIKTPITNGNGSSGGNNGNNGPAT